MKWKIGLSLYMIGAVLTLMALGQPKDVEAGVRNGFSALYWPVYWVFGRGEPPNEPKRSGNFV
jgi:hypothetical protein